MRSKIILLSTAFLLLFLHLPPCRAELKEDFETFRATVTWYESQFPDLDGKLPKASDWEDLEERVSTAPNYARQKLGEWTKSFSASVFPMLQKELWKVGSAVKASPTSEFNVKRRRRLVKDFADLLQSRRIPIHAYYPGSYEALRYGVDGDSQADFLRIDEILAKLAARLKMVLPKELTLPTSSPPPPTGSSRPYPRSNMPSFGGNDTGEDPSAGPVPFEVDDDPLAQKRSPDSARIFLLGGVAMILLGSFAAILLTRWASLGRGPAIRPGTPRREKKTQARPQGQENKDPFGAGMELFQRGKYAEALLYFENIPRDDADNGLQALYYSSIASLRAGDVNLAVQKMQELPLEDYSPEELYRLALAFDEKRKNETAMEIYVLILERDEGFKDVKHLIRKLRERMEGTNTKRGGSSPDDPEKEVQA